MQVGLVGSLRGWRQAAALIRKRGAATRMFANDVILADAWYSSLPSATVAYHVQNISCYFHHN